MASLKKHLLIVLIVALASWLRVWQLEELGIFFGDAGHDILSAITAVEERKLPLLGIESSVPRFKQGPVTVWLHMVIHLFAQQNIYWHWLVFALIGTAAVIGVYEFCQLYLSPRTALLASLLVATSPLAVAHSRMAYHITPIPIMMVLFLAATTRLFQQKKHAVFWATLAWAGLFQFELAVTPLILVIMYLIWHQRRWKNKQTYLEAGLALLLGLWPQILFDLTHRFAHLGGFIVWVGYRLVSLAPTGNHSFSLNTLTTVGTLFTTYWGRIFSVDQPILAGLCLAGLALVVYFLLKPMSRHQLPAGIWVTLVSTLVLALGYLLHGSPSEAYFPPFIVLLPLLLAYGITALPKNWLVTGAVLTVLLAGVNTAQIINHHFFVSTGHSFSYGYGLGEQRQVVTHIQQTVQTPFFFATTHPAGTFANYFDNLRLVAWTQNISENQIEGRPVFVETKNSPLATYPNAIRIAYPSVDLYYLL
jgi:hypothetical protein